MSVLGVDPAVDRAALQPRMGVQLQEGGFVEELTVLETLELWQRLVERTDRPERLLERFELTGRRDVPVSKLSGGEKRRLDLAMAVWGTPELVVLDEPTTGWTPSRAAAPGRDPGAAGAGRTVLLTTHYLEEAEALADRVASCTPDGSRVGHAHRDRRPTNREVLRRAARGARRAARPCGEQHRTTGPRASAHDLQGT